MEIERKYLLPSMDMAKGWPSVEIEQSYVSTSPVIRIRKAGDKYSLCVKGPGAVSREEFEMVLREEQYRSLLKKTEGRVIKKTRYFIPLDDGRTAEADLYHGLLEGLMTVEVEFESVEAMEAFVPPKWFGPDVSDLPEFKNAALALHNYRGIIIH